jgi:hypothetical protein
VARIALVLALLVGVLPVVWGLAHWLPGRLGWVRAAAATRALMDRPDGAEVLAVRALARQDLPRLAALPSGLVAAWRRGEPEATRALARLEAESLGLFLPPR